MANLRGFAAAAILTTSAAAGTWTSLGCYSDNVSGRALTGEPVSGGATNMTIEGCEDVCLGLGYTLAGLEYADECYCGDTLANGAAPATDGCTMACTGDSSETCGGSNRLNVYQYVTGTATSTSATATATATSTTSVSSSTTTGTGKRGLAYNNNNAYGDATYANMFVNDTEVTWGYDWGFPSYNLSSVFEFVPMLWGLPSGADDSWTAAVQTAGTKNILGFNEPDLTYSGSANILPADAAQGYITYMEPFSGSVRIGAPNVLWNNYDGSSSGGAYNSRVWTSYFMGNCTDCHFDFACMHWYQDCDPGTGESGPDWFTSNVTDIYQTLGLPVWITEFQCYGSDSQQAAFLDEVIPWLDSQDYVERYAYFGVFPDYLLDDAGDALSDAGEAFVSA